MAIVLALVTAATFGIGDFSGGLATRRAQVVQVVAWSHVIGGIGALVAALVLADGFEWGDVGLGIIGGGFGMVGVGLLYRRLAVGPMSVVAPLTAITSAVVPGLWGLIRGERFGALGWLGLALALVAVVLVSMTSEQPGADAPVTTRVVVESLAAGVGFGLLFIFFDATGSESAPWPVVGARAYTSSLLIGVLLVRTGLARRSGTAESPSAVTVVPLDRRALPLIAVAGLADTTANVTFLAATNAGELAVVSVLASLYPVSTVLLARLVLSEHMTRPQGIGFVAAMGATVLLSVG